MEYRKDFWTFLFFFILYADERYYLAVASPRVIGWGIGFAEEKKSSILGILGDVFGNSQTNNNKYKNSNLLRLSPCTRFDHLSNSRASNDLSFDNWGKSKSINIENINVSTREIHHGALRKPISCRRVTERTNTNDETNNSSPHVCNRRGASDEAYDSCICASLTVTAGQKTDLTAMTSPIVPLAISFDEQTGEEFGNQETIDRLVASGLEMATEDNNDWIEWKMHGSTKKLFEENNNNEMALLEQGEVLVYIGKSKQEGHGSKLPIIRTKSILPLSAEEMAELLMDSSRVKIYNKLSVGRTDVRSLGYGTKVVCNLTKPPIAKSNMVSCTMIHSRKLEQQRPESDSSYLVVSRATPGMIDDNMSDLPRNDILLGVNLLEDRGPNECVMTAVTHVYSPALPTILAKKMGVSSAINFVKDIRKSCTNVAS